MRDTIITVAAVILICVGVIAYTHWFSNSRRTRTTVLNLHYTRIALSMYFRDHGTYPRVRSTPEIFAELHPSQQKHFNYPDDSLLTDGYGNSIEYLVSSDAKSFILASPGRDGIYTHTLKQYLVLNGPTEIVESPDEDIIVSNRCDLRWPEGIPYFNCKSKHDSK